MFNPTPTKQLKYLDSFIKQSLELRTGGSWFHSFVFMYMLCYISIMFKIMSLFDMCCVPFICSLWPTLILVQTFANKVIFIKFMIMYSTLYRCVRGKGNYTKNYITATNIQICKYKCRNILLLEEYHDLILVFPQIMFKLYLWQKTFFTVNII